MRRWIATAGLVLLASASPARAQSALEPAQPSPWSLSGAVGAPDALTLTATIRARLDLIDGQPRPGFNADDAVVNLRTTLFAEYDTGPVRIGAELIDSRAYEANRGSPVGTNEVDALEPVQFYAAFDFHRPWGEGSAASVKAGRFIVNLGSRRLVAADSYRNTTNSYSGLHADLAAQGGWRASLIYVLPVQRLPDGIDDVLANRIALDREGFDAVLWGGTVARAATIGRAMLEASFLHFGERDRAEQPTRDRSLNTAGARAFVTPAPGRIDWEIEGFYQWGHISNGLASDAATLPVSASFVHADIGYGWARGWRPRVSLRFDYASGDRPGGGFGRFDTLFGMRRSELAPSGLYNSVGRANLLSPGVRVEAAPGACDDLLFAYRPLWLASGTDGFSTTGVRDATGASGRFAGHQAEARWRRWLVRDALRFEWNVLLLARGRFLREAPNASRNGNTLYSSLNLTASF